MKKNKLALLVAFSLQQLAMTGHAQTNPPTQPETRLPEVKVKSSREVEPTYNPPTAVSATKIEAPLRDIPQTINVIPQSLLRDQGARSMEAVMKSVPGIGLSHGDGQRDQVTIRGFSAIADQFIDGLRDDALYFRDLSNIEQVEVIKGPASVLYGRGSSGGLINRITKKPGIDKNEAALTLGSWQQRRGEFDLGRNYSDAGVAFRVTGALEKADSYRDQQFLDRKALSPSLLVKLGADTRLLIQGEYLEDRRVTDFGIPALNGLPVNVPPGTYYGAANAADFDYSQSRVTALGFTLTHRFNNEWSVRNAFRHYDYSLNRNNTLVQTVNQAAQTVSLSRTNMQRAEDGYFNQTELVQKTTLAGMQHQLLYGVEFGRQNKELMSRSQTVATNLPIFNFVAPVVPFTVPAPTSVSDNLGIMKVASAYVQDLATLSEQWKMLAGVRYDRFEQETRQRLAGQPDLNRTDTAWSPRAGLVFQPTPTQSYYVSFSKSFQPSAENFSLATNNAQIAPEETTNREIGAKFDFFDGRASATASLFRIERTNIKSVDPATPGVLQPIGVQRTDGLELTFTGELPQGWQIWSGYAYLDAKVASSPTPGLTGNRATLTPEHSANLWLTKALGYGWRAGAGVNYVGDRQADPANTVTLPAYTTVDAMVGYQWQKLDLQLNLMNLFDRGYIVSAHGSSANLNLPGAPRSVQLTARYNF